MERVVETGSDRQEPSLSEKCGVILQHIRDIHQFYGEKGYRIARKHVAWYLQEFNPIPFLDRLLMRLVMQHHN